MRENLAASGELFFSEAVLLALVDKGRPAARLRDRAEERDESVPP
jgi:hypothetical protein